MRNIPEVGLRRGRYELACGRRKGKQGKNNVVEECKTNGLQYEQMFLCRDRKESC